MVVELDLLIGTSATLTANSTLVKFVNEAVSPATSLHLIGLGSEGEGDSLRYYLYDTVTGNEIPKAIDYNEWVNIKLVCDMTNGDKTVYINGEEFKLTLSANNTDYSDFTISWTRIGQFSKSLVGSVFIDNYKLSYAE